MREEQVTRIVEAIENAAGRVAFWIFMGALVVGSCMQVVRH